MAYDWLFLTEFSHKPVSKFQPVVTKEKPIWKQAKNTGGSQADVGDLEKSGIAILTLRQNRHCFRLKRFLKTTILYTVCCTAKVTAGWLVGELQYSVGSRWSWRHDEEEEACVCSQPHLSSTWWRYNTLFRRALSIDPRTTHISRRHNIHIFVLAFFLFYLLLLFVFPEVHRVVVCLHPGRYYIGK